MESGDSLWQPLKMDKPEAEEEDVGKDGPRPTRSLFRVHPRVPQCLLTSEDSPYFICPPKKNPEAHFWIHLEYGYEGYSQNIL